MEAASEADKAAALQKYGLLQLQQEYLHRRRSISSPTDDGQVTPTPPCQYYSLSPQTSTSPNPSRRSSSLTSADLEMLSQSYEVSKLITAHTTHSPPIYYDDDNEDLVQINTDIKTTLTALLNNADVRNNLTFRTLVQSRLLQIEQELKEARKKRTIERRERRQSSGSYASSTSPLTGNASWAAGADDVWEQKFGNLNL